MRHGLQPTSPARGFTLIELMIVVAVVSILAFVALPAFQDSIRKSRRADAMAGLMRWQQQQERHRGANPLYASAAASMPGPAASPDRHYTLVIDAANDRGYQMTATANATSPQFADTRCRGLRVTMSGGSLTYSSLDADGVVDTTNANRCWVR